MIKSLKIDAVASCPHSSVVLLFLTIIDTTWRLFVPIVGFAIVGVQLDILFKKTPVYMFSMICVGIVCSAVLIKSQLARVKRND